MDNFEILNENNVFNYQMKSYDNPQCHSMEEFLDDMKRIKYVKRLFHKYHTKDILKERLIINHLVVLFNVLGNESCSRILFLKIDKSQHYILASFLSWLNKLPDRITGIEGRVINLEDVVLDEYILETLERKI
jgi:hypothetical protein|tara:strand:+ start:241 stop:639 length:399 start_codon:yes stop_codon:yes gene_type:complete